jgi:hypothetical protein
VSVSGYSGNVEDDKTPAKKIRLRYAGSCRTCGTALAVGTQALYERTSKSVRCLACSEPTDSKNSAGRAAIGVPGTSARREFERRRAAREERIRAKHPHLGGLILAVSDEPQSTKAWAVGANGEETLGQRLDALVGPSVRVLHDRRIPRTRANLDHVVICPGGVWVVDTKQYKGRPHLRVEGGIFTERTEKLMVGSRDCSSLVGGVVKQVGLVRAALVDERVPVRGFLCFVAADWPLFGGSFATRGVTALWPRKLASLIDAPGQLGEDDIATIHARLAKAFPPA